MMLRKSKISKYIDNNLYWIWPLSWLVISLVGVFLIALGCYQYYEFYGYLTYPPKTDAICTDMYPWLVLGFSMIMYSGISMIVYITALKIEAKKQANQGEEKADGRPTDSDT